MEECSSNELKEGGKYFSFPEWLLRAEYEWTKSDFQRSTPLEVKQVKSFHVKTDYENILPRFSLYHRALRILCYVLRFAHNTLKRFKDLRQSSSKEAISAEEIRCVRNSDCPFPT